MKKYRMKGTLHDEVFRVLREDHELGEAAKDSHMQEFGASIRKQLKDVYLDNPATQPLTSTSKQVKFPKPPQWNTDAPTSSSRNSRRPQSYTGTRSSLITNAVQHLDTTNDDSDNSHTSGEIEDVVGVVDDVEEEGQEEEEVEEDEEYDEGVEEVLSDQNEGPLNTIMRYFLT